MSLEVSIGALRRCAGDWWLSSVNLESMASSWTGHIAESGMDLGIFAPLSFVYDRACTAMVTTGTKGAENLMIVSTALKETADEYERIEAEHAALARDVRIGLESDPVGKRGPGTGRK